MPRRTVMTSHECLPNQPGGFQTHATSKGFAPKQALDQIDGAVWAAAVQLCVPDFRRPTWFLPNSRGALQTTPGPPIVGLNLI